MSFWKRLFKKAAKDPTSLGNMLVTQGLCSPEDIEKALTDDRMLGEALVRMGKLQERDLELILAHQQLARRGNGAVRSIADIAISRVKQSTGRWDRTHTLVAAHTEKLK